MAKKLLELERVRLLKKRILSALMTLVCVFAVTSSTYAEETERSFGYDFDAMTLTTPIDVVVPASVTAFLNPYGTTVTFSRKTLKQDPDAAGADRLELSGDVISPAYEIENVGDVPIRVYASVSGQALGSAVLVDSGTDVSVWEGEQQTRDVNLWVTGGFSEEAVNTDSYNIARSISINETETTRTLIERINGSSKGYFKINGKLNKHAKAWSDKDGVHISLVLKIVPIDA